jgi:hypothetical protein
MVVRDMLNLRLLPLLLTLCVVLAAGLFLPGLWKTDRDLGILSSDYLETKGADALAGLTPEARQTLIEQEMAVLRKDPLNADAHRNLALLSLIPPLTDASRSLILNLSRHSLRNPAIQMAAMGVLLENGNLAETAYRMDAVLRAQPALKEQLYPLIAQNFASKDGVLHLAQVLAKDPPWRAGLFTYLAEQPAHEKLGLDLLRELRTTPTPAKSLELRRIFAAWIKQTNSYGRSYFVWLDQLSADELRLVKSVYDGEFTVDAKNLLFDWNIGNTRNGRSSIVLKPGSGTDRALLVEFQNNKDPFQNVFQYLQLSPGPHMMRFDVMSKNFEAETGLVWRISCVGVSKAIVESPAVKTAKPWTRLQSSFEVPEEACETQLLRLETKARRGLDTAANGQVFFDSISIDAITGSTPQ